MTNNVSKDRNQQKDLKWAHSKDKNNVFGIDSSHEAQVLRNTNNKTHPVILQNINLKTEQVVPDSNSWQTQYVHTQKKFSVAV